MKPKYKSESQRYVYDIERLSKSTDNKVKALMVIAAKAIISSYGTDPVMALEIIDDLKISIKKLLSESEAEVIRISKAKNKSIELNYDGEINLSSQKDLLGYKSIDQRLNKYCNDFLQEIKFFRESKIDQGKRNSEIIALITPAFIFENDPETLLKIKKRKLDLINRGLRKPNESTLASSNITRNVYGELFYASRIADMLIWRGVGVSGILIYLNPAHPKIDICDDMAGVYPIDFFFPGWHPSCICLAEPIMRGNFTSIPKKAVAFMSDPKHKKWYNNLYFYKLNKKYFDA